MSEEHQQIIFNCNTADCNKIFCLNNRCQSNKSQYDNNSLFLKSTKNLPKTLSSLLTTSPATNGKFNNSVIDGNEKINPTLSYNKIISQSTNSHVINNINDNNNNNNSNQHHQIVSIEKKSNATLENNHSDLQCRRNMNVKHQLILSNQHEIPVNSLLNSTNDIRNDLIKTILSSSAETEPCVSNDKKLPTSHQQKYFIGNNNMSPIILNNIKSGIFHSTNDVNTNIINAANNLWQQNNINVSDVDKYGKIIPLDEYSDNIMDQEILNNETVVNGTSSTATKSVSSPQSPILQQHNGIDHDIIVLTNQHINDKCNEYLLKNIDMNNREPQNIIQNLYNLKIPSEIIDITNVSDGMVSLSVQNSNNSSLMDEELKYITAAALKVPGSGNIILQNNRKSIIYHNPITNVKTLYKIMTPTDINLRKKKVNETVYVKKDNYPMGIYGNCTNNINNIMNTPTKIREKVKSMRGRGRPRKCQTTVNNEQNNTDVKSLRESSTIIKYYPAPCTRYGRISRPPKHIDNVCGIIENYVTITNTNNNNNADDINKNNNTNNNNNNDNNSNNNDEIKLSQQIGNDDINNKFIENGNVYKRKRKLPEEYICSTCNKIYLGKSKVDSHLLKYPAHIMKKPKLTTKTNDNYLSTSTTSVATTLTTSSSLSTSSSPIHSLFSSASVSHSSSSPSSLSSCSSSLSTVTNYSNRTFEYLMNKIENVPKSEKFSYFISEITDFIENLEVIGTKLLDNNQNSKTEFLNKNISKVLGIKEGNYQINLNALDQNVITSLRSTKSKLQKIQLSSSNSQQSLSSTNALSLELPPPKQLPPHKQTSSSPLKHLTTLPPPPPPPPLLLPPPPSSSPILIEDDSMENTKFNNNDDDDDDRTNNDNNIIDDINDNDCDTEENSSIEHHSNVDYNLSLDSLTNSKLHLSDGMSEESLLNTVDELVTDGMNNLPVDTMSVPASYDHISDNAVEAVDLENMRAKTLCNNIVKNINCNNNNNSNNNSNIINDNNNNNNNNNSNNIINNYINNNNNNSGVTPPILNLSLDLFQFRNN